LGDTPLHSSAWKGHGDIVEMLLDKGANKTLRNNEKQLPYDLAVKNPQVGQLLKITSGKGRL
jgi:ankyrin repeat protein